MAASARTATTDEDDTARSQPTVRELMDTIVALREALETEAAERDRAVQAAVRDAAEEIAQLKALTEQMRTALDGEALDHADALARQDQRFRDENNQLMATVKALRSRLEAGDG